jgi:hypothetical protein
MLSTTPLKKVFGGRHAEDSKRFRARKPWSLMRWLLVTATALLVSIIVILVTYFVTKHVHSHDKDPMVYLNYARYRGETRHDIKRFLGMRYAAAPVGPLRFRAPQDPQQVVGLQDASQVRKNFFK